MNERIFFFIKIYLSHFIFERVMFLVCERWVETRMDCYFDPSSADHSSTSSSSWLGLLNRGSLRAQSPLSAAGSHFGILSPTNSNCLRHLVILLWHAHLLLLVFGLFTQVHLLIDGSVEGQYITICSSPQKNFACEFMPPSSAVPSISLSYLDGLWDGRQMAVQLQFCRVLLPAFVQNTAQHPLFFLQVFC